MQEEQILYYIFCVTVQFLTNYVFIDQLAILIFDIQGNTGYCETFLRRVYY